VTAAEELHKVSRSMKGGVCSTPVPVSLSLFLALSPLLNFGHVSVTPAVRIVTGVHRNDSNSPVDVVRDDACARGECIPGIFQFISFGVLGSQNTE